jgi:hypothetical protein
MLPALPKRCVVAARARPQQPASRSAQSGLRADYTREKCGDHFVGYTIGFTDQLKDHNGDTKLQIVGLMPIHNIPSVFGTVR